MFFDALNPAYLEGFGTFYVFWSICADFRAYPFAYSITTKYPKPLRRSRRRGAAWREQGLDCLSAASYQARRQAAPRQGVFCAWGRFSLLTFFGEAKKVSGVRCRTAQRRQEEFRGWKSARRLWQFLFLVSERVLGNVQSCLPATALFTRAPAALLSQYPA